MTRDVRMRGFAERKDVEEVDRLLADLCTPLPAERVPLLECAGRVLAADIASRVNVPGFARSAMDGYALRGEDTFGAADYSSLVFTLIGEAFPGRAFGGRVGAAEAVRIMTGAPIPDGADAVVKAEVCEERDGVRARRGNGKFEHLHTLQRASRFVERRRRGDVCHGPIVSARRNVERRPGVGR